MQQTAQAENSHQIQFLGFTDDLNQTHQRFNRGEISPLAHSREREAALSSATLALGAMHGIVFQSPMYIDARGEFPLVVLPPGGGDPTHGTGKYGEKFAKILNGHNPRMGLAPGFIEPSNGWCRINHFDLERMVMGQREALLAQQALVAKSVVGSPVVAPSKASVVHP